MRKAWVLRLVSLAGLYAQEIDMRVPVYRMPVVKLYPLTLMDPLQLTLQGALEIPISRQSSTQLEGGWVFGYFADLLPSFIGPRNTQRGFKARIEWRSYLTTPDPDKPQYTLTGFYASAQAGYQHYYQNIGQIDTAFYPPVGYPSTNSTYERTVQALSVSGLLGFQGAAGRRIAIDMFFGIGIRYTIHHWGTVIPPNPDLVERMPVGDLILRRGIRPIPRFGIALGWIL